MSARLIVSLDRKYRKRMTLFIFPTLVWFWTPTKYINHGSPVFLHVSGEYAQALLGIYANTVLELVNNSARSSPVSSVEEDGDVCCQVHPQQAPRKAIQESFTYPPHTPLLYLGTHFNLPNLFSTLWRKNSASFSTASTFPSQQPSRPLTSTNRKHAWRSNRQTQPASSCFAYSR